MPASFSPELLLQATKGTLVNQSGGVSLLDIHDEVTIAWKIPYGSEDDCREWVKAKRLFVKDYQVGKVKLEDYWRCSDFGVSNQYKEVGPHVFTQTFRRGFATTANNTEAYVFSGLDVIEEALYTYNVMFPSVSPIALDSVVRTLAARGAVTDPTFGRSKLIGTFVYSKIEPIQVAQDGIHNILVTLTRVNTITALDDLPTPTKQQKITILRNGEYVNGREEEWILTFNHLNQASRATTVALVENDVAAFVTKYIETVNDWEDGVATVVGSQYEFVPPTDATPDNWLDLKRTLIVEARRVFTMGTPASTDNHEDAITKGWVTKSWEVVLPIKWEEMSDNTARMIVRVQDHRWENIYHDVDGTPRGTDVLAGTANVFGHQARKSRVMKAVPAMAVNEVVEQMSPSSGYVVGSIQITQNGTEAVVGLEETQTYNYINTDATPDELQNPPTVIRTYNEDGDIIGKVEFFPRIAEGELSAHTAIIGNGLETSFFLQRYKEDENPDGSYNLIRYTSLAGDGGGRSAWYYDDADLYEHKRLYRTINTKQYYADVLMRYRIKFDFGTLNGHQLYGAREAGFNPGYAMDGSFFQPISKNLYKFKKVYQMYTIDTVSSAHDAAKSAGDPAYAITMDGKDSGGTSRLIWRLVGEEPA